MLTTSRVIQWGCPCMPPCLCPYPYSQCSSGFTHTVSVLSVRAVLSVPPGPSRVSLPEQDSSGHQVLCCTCVGCCTAPCCGSPVCECCWC